VKSDPRGDFTAVILQERIVKEVRKTQEGAAWEAAGD